MRESVLTGLVILATAVQMARGTRSLPRRLRAVDGSQRADELLVDQRSVDATRRQLNDHLVQGFAFFPVSLYNRGNIRCLSGRSKLNDSVGRAGKRVKMKRCAREGKIKNKERWEIYEGFILSVLKDNDDENLCLYPRRFEEGGRLEMVKCDDIPVTIKWVSFPPEEGADLLKISSDDKTIEFCVNEKARLQKCFDKNGLTAVTEFISISKEAST
mmetsp:Transcript_36875/g.110524  ORF Transcript_36875/g.110524 Transcript_36875/m.110524 type:complete len:215 (-) Transcript_36875:195-839(-)